MSEGKRGKKRPKSYYLQGAAGGKKFKGPNDLDAGMKGFLVTCNKYEKEAVTEMYSLLNEYADKLYGPEVLPEPEPEPEPEKTMDAEGETTEKKTDGEGETTEKKTDGEGETTEKKTDAEGEQTEKKTDAVVVKTENESEEEDMEKAMAKETAKIKEVAKATVRRFQNTDTDTKNLIFIRTTLDDPCKFAHEIFSDIVEKQVQKARYALRMIPVQITCKTNMNNIKEAAEKIFKPVFDAELRLGLKYTLVFKIRFNDRMSRNKLLPIFNGVIQKMNPLHQVCHVDPDLVIIIEILRSVCCLSVTADYFKYKKFNLHEVVKKPTEEADSSKDADNEESKPKDENGALESDQKTGAEEKPQMDVDTKTDAEVKA